MSLCECFSFFPFKPLHILFYFVSVKQFWVLEIKNSKIFHFCLVPDLIKYAVITSKQILTSCACRYSLAAWRHFLLSFRSNNTSFTMSECWVLSSVFLTQVVQPLWHFYFVGVDYYISDYFKYWTRLHTWN